MDDAGNPVIRFFGVNSVGNSIVSYIHNNKSYFFLHITEEDTIISQEDNEKIKNDLNEEIGIKGAVEKIEVVQKQSVMFYKTRFENFLKVFVSNPKFIPQLRSVVENGLNYAGKDCLSKITYESDIPYVLRFMLDNEIAGMTWIRIEKGKWKLRSKEDQKTNCQIEFDVLDHSDIKCFPSEGKYS